MFNCVKFESPIGKPMELSALVPLKISVYEADQTFCGLCPYMRTRPFLSSNQHYEECNLFGATILNEGLTKGMTSTEFECIKRCSDCIKYFG